MNCRESPDRSGFSRSARGAPWRHYCTTRRPRAPRHLYARRAFCARAAPLARLIALRVVRAPRIPRRAFLKRQALGPAR